MPGDKNKDLTIQSSGRCKGRPFLVLSALYLFDDQIFVSVGVKRCHLQAW